MGSLVLIGAAAHPPVHVMWEEVIAIMTLIVPETLAAEITIAKEISHLLEVTGADQLIAVSVSGFSMVYHIGYN